MKIRFKYLHICAKNSSFATTVELTAIAKLKRAKT